RGDVHARGGDLRLEGVGAGHEAPAGEVRRGVVAVHGADGEHVGRAGGGGGDLPRAGVAGGGHEQAAAGGGEVLGGRADRVAAAAEAHGDHVGLLGDGPLHAGDDPGLGAVAPVVQHLADHQLGAGGDALLGAVAGRAGAGGDRRGVGAVPEVVAGRAGPGEVRG